MQKKKKKNETVKSLRIVCINTCSAGDLFSSFLGRLPTRGVASEQDVAPENRGDSCGEHPSRTQGPQGARRHRRLCCRQRNRRFVKPERRRGHHRRSRGRHGRAGGARTPAGQAQPRGDQRGGGGRGGDAGSVPGAEEGERDEGGDPDEEAVRDEGAEVVQGGVPG